MTESPNTKAVKKYRKRLAERGMKRFEVLGLETDRELIRALAKRLAEDDAGAAEIRASVTRSLRSRESTKGGILRALRRSPMVGADLDLSRPVTQGRKVDI